jgi:hypothetical protein
VAWTAATADYLTSQPSCNTSTLGGPDLVMSYTAPEDGFVRFTLHKPSGARQVLVVSTAACGTLTPELACSSDTTTAMPTELTVEQGKTYNVYVRDTTSGTAPLQNPLTLTLDETRCSNLVPTVTNISPVNGATIADQTPVLTAELPYPFDSNAGVITVTRSAGPSLSFDLATSPAELALVNGGKTLLIDPGVRFSPNEDVTVTWSGLHDATCGAVISPPTWKFKVSGPSCAPGVNGMVGNTITRVPTGLTTSFTEYFVAADSNPNGYVYFGGTSDLYRTPKAGGTTENIETIAALTSTQEGYDMVIAGDEIYTLEANTSTTVTSNLLWRLSTNSGATWNVQNYMQLPQPANDDMHAITHHEGRLFMTTEDTAATEIWSVAAGATTLPQSAVLEATLTGEYSCNGIAVDDAYYYLACTNGDRLIRVDRTTHAVELISNAIDIVSTKDALHAHDLDGDGRADVLYVSAYFEEVNYVCGPSGQGPFFVGVLANFGSSTTNYGLGFDRANNALWMFDDDTRELVKIQ